MLKGRNTYLCAGSALFVVSLLVPFSNSALAQSGTAEAADSADDVGIPQIIVTAQRRDERLQDTPITVAAISGDAALEKGVLNATDLRIVTPGFVISDGGFGSNIYLRGVGTQNSAPGDEGSTATYIDGVYQSSLPGAITSFSNVERVEVLKGPQGTLFGRNATSGLINVITRDPSFTPRFDASVLAETYETFGGDLYFTAPLSSNVAMNLSAYYKDQNEGWGTNVATGEDVYQSRQLSLRSKILMNVGPSTELILSGDYSSNSSAHTAGALNEGSLGEGGNVGLPGFYDYDSDLQPRQFTRNAGGYFRATHEMPWATVVNTVAYRRTKFGNDFDADRSPSAITNATTRYTVKTFSEELQLQSPVSSTVKWIAGLFYLTDKVDMYQLILEGSAWADFGGVVNAPASQTTRSLAAFAQVTVPLGERTNVTGGLRYTDDRRKISSFFDLPVFDLTIPAEDQRLSFGKLTYRLSVDHHLSDEVMAFASYNRGFKSGVFNFLAPTDPAVRPEQIDAFEVGLKSELLDRRLRVNVAGFLYKYKDIQLTQAESETTFLLNAAKATVKGIDADITAVLMPGLTISANGEYLDAHYDEFLNAPATFRNPATCGPPPMILPGPATGGNLICFVDVSGAQMVRAPKFSGTLGLRYELSTANAGTFVFNADLYHSSSFSFEAENRLLQPSYEILNAQLSWEAKNGRYGVRIYGRNILNKKYFNESSASGSGDTFGAAPPATAGVAFNVHF